MKYDRLTDEELCLYIQSGDEKALLVLTTKNKGFIEATATNAFNELNKSKKITENRYDKEDKFSEAQIAFINAAYNYRNDSEAKFQTYAYACIVNAIKKYFFADFVRKEDALTLIDDKTGEAVNALECEHFIKTYGKDPFTESAEAIYFFNQFYKIIDEAITNLTKSQRQYLSYRYGLGVQIFQPYYGNCAEEYSTNHSRNSAMKFFSLTRQDAESKEKECYRFLSDYCHRELDVKTVSEDMIQSALYKRAKENR